MRVCILGKSDVPVCSLSRWMARRGLEVHVVAGKVEQEPPPGVRLHRIALSARTLPATIARVRQAVAEIGADLLHAFYLTSYGFLASRVPGPPVLATAMGTDVFGAPELSPWLAPARRALARQAIRRADRLHSVSPEMTRRLVELGADPSRIETFPRGVAVERFRSERPGSHQGPWSMVCTRRLEPVYDHRTLLEAVERLRRRGRRDVDLRIVGAGSLAESLRAHRARLDLEGVRFEPEVPHDRVPALLAGADLYLSASLSDGTSSCLLEAMAAGCIPVVSDIPANRAWIREGVDGFLFPPGDPEGAADAVERALSARAAWPRIRAANRARTERDASMEAGCHRVLRLYEQILEGRTPCL